MPDDLHHLPRPPPSPETSTAKARALSKTWRLLLPPPSPPRHRDARHTAPPPPTHTGNVGVMTNTSTQPIGNTLIEFDTPPTLTHAAESP